LTPHWHTGSPHLGLLRQDRVDGKEAWGRKDVRSCISNYPNLHVEPMRMAAADDLQILLHVIESLVCGLVGSREGQAISLSKVTTMALTGQAFTQSSQALHRSDSNATSICGLTT